jgi:hypothetical protein
MAWHNRWNDYEEGLEYEEDRKDYTNKQLNQLADDFLREDAKKEICRECGGEGTETGNHNPISQKIEDEEGNELIIDFPEYQCNDGHKWYQGEGKAKGIKGDNPILFEEHLQQRRRREIYNATGTPDPAIKAGIYNRTHPQGRKVNSPEQRKKNGASYYR